MALRVECCRLSGHWHNACHCTQERQVGGTGRRMRSSKSRADELVAKFQVKAYYSLGDMLANETWTSLTFAPAIKTAVGTENPLSRRSSRKHVLCEKPISNDVEEAREMVKLAAKKDLYLGVNLNHYFTQPADEAMKLIKDGKIGEIIYCHLRTGFPGSEWAYARTGGPNMEGYPYFHVKAFLAHPFSIMRYFCGNICQLQSFFSKPSYRIATAGDGLRQLNPGSKTEQWIHVLVAWRRQTTTVAGGRWRSAAPGYVRRENCVESSSTSLPRAISVVSPQGLGLAPES